MEYDNYGNITKKNGKTYTYGNSKWKDLLTSYNGQTITYDAQGNPVKYLGHTLTWEKGRQLKKFDNIEYTYNANGIRTSKKVNGVLHTYTLDGTKILRETWNGNTLIPLYDNEDSVCGILYNNNPYYFIKNLQGDVIAIVDKDAQTVARYSYDAWGAVTSAVTYTDLTNDVEIAIINPFRYRSYYYDEEIELYYLQSRYYDADVGRFINSDSIEILNFNDKNAISIQYGLFTYAVNDPVNEVDFAGSYSIGKVIKTVLSAIGKGLLSQFYTDMILYAFDVLVLNKNVELKLSPGEDYAYSVLCALVDEFLSTPKYMMYIKLAGIAAKYLWKFVCGRMQSKDWGTLVVDVLSVIVEYYLKNLQKKYSSQIKKLKKKKKNSKNLERKMQSKKNTAIIIKIYYCGIHLNITLPVSNLLLSFVLNIIFW